MRSIFDQRSRPPLTNSGTVPTMPDKYDERSGTKTAATQPNGKAFKGAFAK